MTVSKKTGWKIPTPLATHVVEVDAETSIVLRRHGNPVAPQRLVLTHGNGFSIDSYYPFWSLLREDFDVIVYDLRNHGWNTPTAINNHNIPVLVQDHDKVNVAIAQHYGCKPTAGVFHSISSFLPLLSSYKNDSYEAMVLFDPPLASKLGDCKLIEQSLLQRVGEMRRRATHFASLEEFAELLTYSPYFQHVVDGAVELFARTTLRACAEGGGYQLRCPREHEAQLAEYASSYVAMISLDELTSPTKVIGADPTVPSSYLPSFNLSDMRKVDYDFLPDTTHLLQIEQPEACVAAMHDFFTSISFV